VLCMRTFAPTPTNPEALRAHYEAQIAAPHWDSYFEDIGGTILPEPGDPMRFGVMLDNSNAKFDKRGGGVRNAKENPVVTAAFEAQPLKAQKALDTTLLALGNVGSSGIYDDEVVDLGVVFAGLNDSNAQRASYMQGKARSIAYAATNRLATPVEQAKLAEYDPHTAQKPGLTEADVNHAIMRKLHPERELVAGDNRVEIYKTPSGYAIWLEAEPGERREQSNAQDALQFLNRIVGSHFRTVVGVTGDMYREFQHTSALLELHGAQEIQTIAFSPQDGIDSMHAHGFDLGHNVVPPKRTPSTYIQEVHSSIRKYDRLRKMLEKLGF